MSTPTSPPSPLNLIRRGFDWSGTTPRLPYILITLAVIGLASLIPVTCNFSGANTAVFVSLTMAFPIWLGHTRRRLRDVGWSGWLMWVAILPVVGLILTIFLAFKPGGNLNAQTDTRYSKLGFVVSLIVGCLLLSRAFWAPYWIPAGSMKPNLLIGDFVIVVPVNTPQRGDILVFNKPGSDAEYIKRLIGMPGETVQMRDGVVYVNDDPLPQSNAQKYAEPFALQGAMQIQPRCANDPAPGEACLKTRVIETQPGGRSYAILDISPHVVDNIERRVVPEGQYFFLGDNRDNSSDSRMSTDTGGMGLIPRENITGRVSWVLFSSAGERLMQIWNWRPNRYLKRVK